MSSLHALLVKHDRLSTEACQGAKFHSPRPLAVHAYVLPDKHVIYLCGTCRDNLGVYLFLWNAEGGLDWETKRCFGNQIRNVAQKLGC